MAGEWVQPQWPHWPRPVRVLTTTREDGDAAVPADRHALQSRTGIARVQWLRQVHGTDCVEASSGSLGTVPEADAAWTRERGLGLAVMTADCVPAVIGARDGSVLGVAHGGWRGLVSGVLENLVATLPVDPAELVAWLGPAIGPGAYEVGEDVAAAVRGLRDGRRLADDCLLPGTPGRHFLDLFTLSERLLTAAGVGAVTTERWCTHSDRRFYSYRRDGSAGRMVTLAWLDV